MGCLFLIISPRIFAHSFFNNKDKVKVEEPIAVGLIMVYFTLATEKKFREKYGDMESDIDDSETDEDEFIDGFDYDLMLSY